MAQSSHRVRSTSFYIICANAPYYPTPLPHFASPLLVIVKPMSPLLSGRSAAAGWSYQSTTFNYGRAIFTEDSDEKMSIIETRYVTRDTIRYILDTSVINMFS